MMKKYRFIFWSLCATLLLSMQACKKSFLEVVPKKVNVLTTYSDYNLLMNGSNFYVLGQSLCEFAPFEIMGDEVAADNYAFAATGSYGSIVKGLFSWQGNIFPAASEPSFVLSLETNIYSLNVVINGAEALPDGTKQQKLELKSEALAQRAYTNFILVNLFAKPYNSSTAANDPGFPYTTVSNIQGETFERGTVQQSYDQMIADLSAAIPNLNISPAIRTRMSKPAAEALLGRIYLSMNRYNDALTQLNASFSDMGKMSNPPVLYDYNTTFSAGGSFTQTSSSVGPSSPYISTTDLTESLWGVMTSAVADGNPYPTDPINLTAGTVALFDPTDWRLKFYTNLQRPTSSSSAIIPGGRLHRYNLVYTRIGIELPDLYLMRAEVEARSGNLGAALQDVLTLRQNRMPAAVSPIPTTITGNQTSLVKFILDERIREFASTGYRWLDMRRLSNDPLFANAPAAQHIYYNDDAANTSTSYTLSPSRLTLKIPKYILDQNTGWVDNP